MGHRWARRRKTLRCSVMVKMPRKVMRYSPSAGKHTEHTVERVKKRRASELKWGQRRFRKATSDTEVSLVQSPLGKSQPSASTYSTVAPRPERLTSLPHREQRSLNSWRSDIMGDAKFLRVNCRDCGHETIIFERASTQISCSICGSTLARPAGGKA